MHARARETFFNLQKYKESSATISTIANMKTNHRGKGYLQKVSQREQQKDNIPQSHSNNQLLGHSVRRGHLAVSTEAAGTQNKAKELNIRTVGAPDCFRTS